MTREVGVAAALAQVEIACPSLVAPLNDSNEDIIQGRFDNVTSHGPVTGFPYLLSADNGKPLTDSFALSSAFTGILASPSFLPVRGRSIDTQSCSVSTGRQGIASAPEQHLSSFTAKYKSMMPSRLPIPATSTYLTIPPGLSPTTLLDSPVLLNAELTDPSPTTGSLHRALKTEVDHVSSAVDAVKQEDVTDQQDCFGSLRGPLDRSSESLLVSAPPADDASLAMSMPIFESTSGHASGFLQKGSHLQNSSLPVTLSSRSAEVVRNAQVSSMGHQCISERTSVDGYNWKKYGQKQLKGTEFPRSYYKCTHPNCPVKKQVECSHEGEITEIMYKGEHNHARPQGNRRGARTTGGGQSLAHENTVDVSSTLYRTESDRFSVDLSSSSLVGGLGGTPEQSFGSPGSDEGDDFEHGKAEDEGEDEQDSKRRRTGNLRETLSTMPIRTIREPRVIVQTTSEVDILDDGYRWRKYGQKVVKGNCFPRSYYKCTNKGCIVRKHVERSSTDPTSVMTAYEGKHNHNVPVARGTIRETTGVTADPLSLATFAGVGLSSVKMAARPAMPIERDGLTSHLDNGFSGGSRFDVSIASPFLSHTDGNSGEILASSKTAGQSVGLSITRSFGAGGEISRQDFGPNFLQSVYPSRSSSCLAEGHLSRS